MPPKPSRRALQRKPHSALLLLDLATARPSKQRLDCDILCNAETTGSFRRRPYDKTVEAGEIVVIDFWANWCAPCAEFAPIFERTSEKYPDTTFTKLNSHEETGISNHYFIQNTPTTVVLKEKTVVFKKPGVLSEAELIDMIEKTKVLDMEQFRTEKAAQKAARRAARK